MEHRVGAPHVMGVSEGVEGADVGKLSQSRTEEPIGVCQKQSNIGFYLEIFENTKCSGLPKAITMWFSTKECS